MSLTKAEMKRIKSLASRAEHTDSVIELIQEHGCVGYIPTIGKVVELEDDLNTLIDVREMTFRHNNDERDTHPCPENDSGIRRGIHQDEVCAFKNCQQLEFWFTDSDLDMLEYEGFTVVEYEVDASDVVIGQRQIVVKKEALNLACVCL